MTDGNAGMDPSAAETQVTRPPSTSDVSATGSGDRPVTPRWYPIAARALTIVAVLLTVTSVLANFVKREFLDPVKFRETSRTLIADPTIRAHLADRLVDELYENVDVTAALRERLPPDIQELSGPIAGTVRNAADGAARRMLEQPRVQDAFVSATALSQRQLIAVLDDDLTFLRTGDGTVALDVRPLVLQLGDRFSIVPDLETRVPPGAAQVTIMQSERLKSVQDSTRLLRFVADWIWLLALAAAVAAVWFARGQRRRELRALGIGLAVAGLLVLIIRTLLGRHVVNDLVTSESARPAAAEAYSILTDLLRGGGWTAILIALIALAGIWLSGPGARAVPTRRALAPHLRRPEVAYGALVVLYLLLLWWRPTPQFGFARTIIVWFVLAAVGVEVLRRQTAREFPDAEPVDLAATVRGWFAWRPRATRQTSTVDDLERVARLHSGGQLDDDEFAVFKARLIGAGSSDQVTETAVRAAGEPPPSATPPADRTD